MIEKFPVKNSITDLLCLPDHPKTEILGPWKTAHYKIPDRETDADVFSELLLLSRTGYFSKEDLEEKGMQLTDENEIETSLQESFYFAFEPKDLSTASYKAFRQACAEIGFYYPKRSEGLFYVVDYILSTILGKTRKYSENYTPPLIIGYTNPENHFKYEAAEEILFSSKSDNKEGKKSLDFTAEEICHYIVRTTGLEKFDDILRYLGNERTPLSQLNYDVVDEFVVKIINDDRACRLLSRQDILEKIKSIYYDNL